VRGENEYLSRLNGHRARNSCAVTAMGCKWSGGSYCEAQRVRKGTGTGKGKQKTGCLKSSLFGVGSVRQSAAEASLHVGFDSVLRPRKTALDPPGFGSRNTKTCS
jgi:hypothetical protein